MAATLPTADEVRAIVRDELQRALDRLREDQEVEVVSQSEAARRLGVSLRTVQRLVARGELSSVKVGGARRVRLSGVFPPATGTG